MRGADEKERREEIGWRERWSGEPRTTEPTKSPTIWMPQKQGTANPLKPFS